MGKEAPEMVAPTWRQTVTSQKVTVEPLALAARILPSGLNVSTGSFVLVSDVSGPLSCWRLPTSHRSMPLGLMVASILPSGPKATLLAVTAMGDPIFWWRAMYHRSTDFGPVIAMTLPSGLKAADGMYWAMLGMVAPVRRRVATSKSPTMPQALAPRGRATARSFPCGLKASGWAS